VVVVLLVTMFVVVIVVLVFVSVMAVRVPIQHTCKGVHWHTGNQPHLKQQKHEYTFEHNASYENPRRAEQGASVYPHTDKNWLKHITVYI
jgi:hypothetical protein